jgi:hypothetical protein
LKYKKIEASRRSKSSAHEKDSELNCKRKEKKRKEKEKERIFVCEKEKKPHSAINLFMQETHVLPGTDILVH